MSHGTAAPAPGRAAGNGHPVPGGARAGNSHPLSGLAVGVPLVLVGPLALLAANLLAAWPGQRAARLRSAQVLRAE